MQKIIGCLLILAGTTGFGFAKGQELQLHLKELEMIKQIFYFIRSELQYMRAPFEEIFRKVGKKTSGIYGMWLENIAVKLSKKSEQSFEEIWKTSIEECLGNSWLKEDDIKELREVGKNLSYIETVNLYIEQLEYKIKNTREEYQTKRKLCQSLGIMGGVFLVILLL